MIYGDYSIGLICLRVYHAYLGIINVKLCYISIDIPSKIGHIPALCDAVISTMSDIVASNSFAFSNSIIHQIRQGSENLSPYI